MHGSVQFQVHPEAGAAEWFFHFSHPHASPAVQPFKHSREEHNPSAPAAKKAPCQGDSTQSPAEMVRGASSLPIEMLLSPVNENTLHRGANILTQTESPLDASGSFQSLESRDLNFPGM